MSLTAASRCTRLKQRAALPRSSQCSLLPKRRQRKKISPQAKRKPQSRNLPRRKPRANRVTRVTAKAAAGAGGVADAADVDVAASQGKADQEITDNGITDKWTVRKVSRTTPCPNMPLRMRITTRNLPKRKALASRGHGARAASSAKANLATADVAGGGAAAVAGAAIASAMARRRSVQTETDPSRNCSTPWKI